LGATLDRRWGKNPCLKTHAKLEQGGRKGRFLNTGLCFVCCGRVLCEENFNERLEEVGWFAVRKGEEKERREGGG